MTRIAIIKEPFYVDFDQYALYEGNNRIKTITRKSLEVLEYFCTYPHHYKQTEDINLYLEEGCLSHEAIRGRIHRLKEIHPVFRECILHEAGKGYVYIGGNIQIDSEELPKATDSSPGLTPTKNLDVDSCIAVEELASELWKQRPFYLDEEFIEKIYKLHGYDSYFSLDSNPATYQILTLMKDSFQEGETITMEQLPDVPANMLVTVKGKFRLTDLYASGKHLDAFTDPLSLTDIDEEKVTFLFESTDPQNKITMYLSGKKTFFPMRHLIPIIFHSDRMFQFQILGFLDRMTTNSYHMKPLSIVYM